MLVDYPSEDEAERCGSDADAEAEPVRPKRAASPSLPPAKRAKLPSLPPSFSPIADDPAQHGGRTRSRPFTDGDYYAHVYIALGNPNPLASVVARVLPDAAHAFDSLHVSLSHPIPLRRDMRGGFVADIRAAVGNTGAFSVSLAPKSVVYYNSMGERKGKGVDRGRPLPGGRAFLALVVGAGVKPLSGLLERIDDVLKRHHLPVYHQNPEFHASLAWGLVEDKPFPPKVLSRLDALAEDILQAQPKTGWTVNEVLVKVAKDITPIPL